MRSHVTAINALLLLLLSSRYAKGMQEKSHPIEYERIGGDHKQDATGSLADMSSSSQGYERWNPRVFTVTELSLMKSPLGLRQEILSTGMVMVKVDDGVDFQGGVGERFAMDESIVYLIASSIVQNFEVSGKMLTSSDDKSASNDGLVLSSSTHAQVLGSEDGHIMDIKRRSNESVIKDEKMISSGVLTAIYSFGSKTVTDEVGSNLLVNVEFDFSESVTVQIASNEILFLVGTQWQEFYKTLKNEERHNSALRFPRMVPYTIHKNVINSYYERTFYAKSKLRTFPQAIHNSKDYYDVSHQDGTLIGDRHHVGMKMDMDDDDSSDDDSFCSGGGMTMNMDGMGISFSNSDRSCLNLIFESWTLDTNGKFVLAMFGVVLLGMFAGK